MLVDKMMSNSNRMGWKWSCTILSYQYNTGLKEWKEPHKPSASMHLGSDLKLIPSQHEVGELLAMWRPGSEQERSERRQYLVYGTYNITINCHDWNTVQYKNTICNIWSFSVTGTQMEIWTELLKTHIRVLCDEMLWSVTDTCSAFGKSLCT
jgi:hypothetical protein